jgi:hypothetical protein
MRKLILVFCLAASSCCTVNREAMDALEQNWRLLEPVTRRGIETDPDLSEESKATRLRNVDEFGLLIVEVKNAAR